MSSRRLLVTGCGRSGTKYIAFVCRRLGLDVRHEELGRDGIASWTMAVNTHRRPYGPSSTACSFTHVFHQVREPLATIESATTFGPEAWSFICSFTSCSLGEPVLLRSARYWLTWNERAEQIAEWQYRVEDLRASFREFCSRLDVACDPAVLARVPTDVNTRRHGRRLHLVEEALERARIDMPTGLRRRLRTPEPGNGRLAYADLDELDPVLSARIREKAAQYGYAT